MIEWLNRLFRRSSQAAVQEERQLAADSKVRQLVLEMADGEKKLAQVIADLERHHRQQATWVTEALDGQKEHLFGLAAGSVSHLLTQMYLLNVEGKSVETKDVLAVALRLIQVLEDEGLTREGSVGSTTPYDPNRHEPLNAGVELSAGQAVVVRFVGVAYGGKILRKAGVEEAAE